MSKRCTPSAPIQMRGGPACMSSLASTNTFTGTTDAEFWNYSCVNTNVNEGLRPGPAAMEVPASAVEGTTQLFGSGNIISAYNDGTPNVNSGVVLGSTVVPGGDGVYYLLAGGNLMGMQAAGAGALYSTCGVPDTGEGNALYVTSSGNVIIKDIKSDEIIFARGCTVGAKGAIPDGPHKACLEQWAMKETVTKEGDMATPSLCSGNKYALGLMQTGQLFLINMSTGKIVWVNNGQGFPTS